MPKIAKQSEMFQKYLLQTIKRLGYCPPGVLTKRDISVDFQSSTCLGGFSEVKIGKWIYGQKVAIKRIRASESRRKKVNHHRPHPSL